MQTISRQMLFNSKSRLLIIICLVLSLTAGAIVYLKFRASKTLARNASPTAARMSGFPKIFLWAWERPEHLEFITPRETGVAFLAATIHLRGEKAVLRPRLQPLKVPEGTTLIAVVRIESARDAQPTLSETQRGEIVEDLIKITRQPNVAALQIDFDVAESERQFYRLLLNDARRRMPETMPLSMTALASWCIFDKWLDDLPVDEAVPMFFEMGIDQHRIANYLQTGGEIRAPLCRNSIGVSTDETVAILSSTSRIYIFNPQAWTESTVRQALERNRHETPNP